MIEKTSRKKSRIFRKNENGDDIFYPWGYPGRGWYITDALKKKIVLFLNIYAACICLYILFFSLASQLDWISNEDVMLLYLGALLVFSAVREIRIYAWVKYLTPYTSLQKDSLRFSSFLVLNAVIHSFNMIAVLFIFNNTPELPLYVSLCVPGLLWSVWLFIIFFLEKKSKC